VRAVDIGIIGGADGPTAVFVTGEPWLAALLAVLALAVVTAIAVHRRRKKKS